ELKRKLVGNLRIEIAAIREYVEVAPSGVGIVELAVVEADGKREGSIVVHVVQDPGFRRVVKKTVAAPDAGFSTSRHIPGETGARTDVLHRPLRAGLGDHVAVGQLVPGVENSGRGIDKMRRDDSLDVHFLNELILAIEQI